MDFTRRDLTLVPKVSRHKERLLRDPLRKKNGKGIRSPVGMRNPNINRMKIEISVVLKKNVVRLEEKTEGKGVNFWEH